MIIIQPRNYFLHFITLTGFLLILLLVLSPSGTSQNLEAQGVNSFCGDTVTCSCADSVNATRTLTASDSVVSGTCTGVGLNITSNNVLLDCAGLTITGDGGTVDDNALKIANRNNVTVQNCVFNLFGEGASNSGAFNVFTSNNIYLHNITVLQTVAIDSLLIADSNNVTVNNSNFTNRAKNSDGVTLQGLSRFNKFYNVSIFVDADTGTRGLYLDLVVGFNTFENLTIFANNTSGGGNAIVSLTSGNNTFDNLHLYAAAGGSAINLQTNSNNNTFKNSYLSASTTALETTFVANNGFGNQYINNTFKGSGPVVTFSENEQNTTFRENNFELTDTASELFTFRGTSPVAYNHSIDLSNKILLRNMSLVYLGPSNNGSVIDLTPIGALYVFYSRNHLIKNSNLSQVHKVLIFESANITMNNNTITGNYSAGSTLNLTAVNNSLFKNNNITLHSNVLSGAGHNAAFIARSVNNTFENTTFYVFPATSGGIFLTENSKYNVFRHVNITALTSAGTGLDIRSGSGFNIFENITIDTPCSLCAPVTLSATSNNTFDNGRISSQDVTPVTLATGSNNNTFRNFFINSSEGVAGITFDTNAGFENALINNTIRVPNAQAVIFGADEQNYTLRENKFFTGTSSSISITGTTFNTLNHSIDSSNKEGTHNLSIYYLKPGTNLTVIDGKKIGALYAFFTYNIIIKNSNLSYAEVTILQDSNNITFINNTVGTNLTTTTPLQLIRVNNSIFYNNNITLHPASTATTAALLQTGINNTFENTTISSVNVVFGALLVNSNSKFNTFKHTNVTVPSAATGSFALNIDNSGFNVFENTTIDAPCTPCISLYLSTASNNTFDNGKITSNSRALSLEFTSNNNTFKNMHLNATSGEAIGTTLLGSGVDNVGFGNKFINLTLNVTSGVGLNIATETNATFKDILIRATSGTGINLSFGNINLTFEKILITSTSGRGIVLNDGNHTFRDIWVNSSSTSCTSTTGCDLVGNSVDATSVLNFTNITLVTPQILSLDTDYEFRFTNLTFENISSIEYKNVTWRSFAFNSNNNITLQQNRSFINGTTLPALNQSARLVFRGLPNMNYYAIVDPEDDGAYASCATTRCINTSMSGTTFSFNASSWTTYAVQTFSPRVQFSGNTQTNNTFINSETIFINVTATIPNPSNEANITFTFANASFVNSTVYTTAVRNITFAVNDSNMEYTYNVTFTDVEGKQNVTERRTITLDTTNPSTSITSSVGTRFIERTTTTVTCTTSETNPSSMNLKEGTDTLCSAVGDTKSCSASLTPQLGVHTLTCKAIDKANNEGTRTLTLEALRKQGTDEGGGGGGSGGGGGGGGGASRSVIIGTVTVGESSTVRVADSTIGVHEVSFTAKNTLSSAQVVVTARAEDQVSDRPQNPVYKYFNVDTKNFDDNDVTNGIITFLISERWLSQHNAQAEDVVLLRQEEATWKAYPARLLSVEKGIIRFQSIVPGFSTFAIALKSTPIKEETPLPILTLEETAETPEEPRKNLSTFRKILVALLLLALVVGGAHILFNKKLFNKKHKR